METSDNLGLKTRDALHILYREIEIVLHQFKQSRVARSTKSWLKDSFHHSSQHTIINWISICMFIWSCTSLILVHHIGPENYSIIGETFTILLCSVLSISLEIYDNYLRHDELPRRVRNVLDKIQVGSDNISWKEEHYPTLFMPTSPCITLQWTYRDGKLVNLPWSLLVKGDVVLIRPGQSSPGYCECLEKNTNEQSLLHAKEIFAPSMSDVKDLLSTPRICKPSKGCKYCLLETPYLNNLRIMLEQALDKPVTHHNHQRHILLIDIIQRIIIPLIIIVFYAVSVLKYCYFKFDKPAELFLLVPVCGVLPLLPIVFPIVWKLLNYFGMAKLQAIFDATKNFSIKDSLGLEDDPDNKTIEHNQLKLKNSAVMNNFFVILKGGPEIVSRSVNILHVLGSVTALCCIDKKGVLSWPNPTAEKVFFLHNNEVSPNSSLGNVVDLEMDSSSGTPLRRAPESPCAGAAVEVLDLTHNHHDPFKLHFDDHDWRKHLSSLKPLGLAILLNTCNVDTREQYSQFCSHIMCEALNSENLVPVTNRRCLCELAKEIGFLDQAQKIFQLEQKLCTFRHLQADIARRDNKYVRSLHISSSRLKFPFPHMFAVVVREISSGAMQLLSEGTADIIVDSCADYWDGKDLCALVPADRKRIQDFYQRTSLTAYCTAFAYRPLNRGPSSVLASSYLELPNDSRQFYINRRSPTPLHWDRGVLEPHTGAPYFYSTDSLLYAGECEPEEVDADGCFQMQCNQVFIGMVSMQYQVLTDMVHLIEQLERACIRFVHFSKENELRSRVFSEKMGLESGWNCHISLLSDRNSNLESSRTMSFSAPSAINIEHSTVRFDADTTNRHCSDQSTVNESKEISKDLPGMSNTQPTSHEWQSLSCLTDSTDQSAPIHFDMSNRAKLPRGIDKIRPHIELIDNVPLLVSLFTDCTSSATREMINIMQDYGEIICVLGSAANCDNAGIFMQADASVAVEPLYPQVCQKIDVFEELKSNCLSPAELASELNSLASALTVKREDPISFFHLIMESRHFVIALWNTVQFWVSCCAVVTGVQLACSLTLLPPPLTVGQVLWLICIVIPFISASLIALPIDMGVMKTPLGKNNLVLNIDMLLFILWSYGLKFLPTILVVLTVYGGILSNHCTALCSVYVNCTCLMHHTPFITGNDVYVGGWKDSSWTIIVSRIIISCVLVLHFVFISIGFVLRGHLIFRRSPHTNKIWLITVSIFVILQCLNALISYKLVGSIDPEVQFPVPIWVIVFAVVSPLIVFLINELAKYQEIKVNDRFQKRARLDFGTKLGMNSPF